MAARWPVCGEVEELLLKEVDYLTDVSHDFRVRIKKMVELRGKVGVVCLLPWQQPQRC